MTTTDTTQQPSPPADNASSKDLVIAPEAAPPNNAPAMTDLTDGSPAIPGVPASEALLKRVSEKLKPEAIGNQLTKAALKEALKTVPPDVQPLVADPLTAIATGQNAGSAFEVAVAAAPKRFAEAAAVRALSQAGVPAAGLVVAGVQLLASDKDECEKQGAIMKLVATGVLTSLGPAAIIADRLTGVSSKLTNALSTNVINTCVIARGERILREEIALKQALAATVPETPIAPAPMPEIPAMFTPDTVPSGLQATNTQLSTSSAAL